MHAQIHKHTFSVTHSNNRVAAARTPMYAPAALALRRAASALPAASLLAAGAAGCFAMTGSSWDRSTFSVQADSAKPAGVPAPGANALDPNEWREFKLQSKKKLTPNTYLFRFVLPNQSEPILPVASCLVVKADLPEEGSDKPKTTIRPYTPVEGGKGYLDLIVKVYPTGKMSKHIGELKEGETLAFKGPIPKYPYKANHKKHIGLIAGGSGLTPMLQVADEVLRNPNDKTQVSFIFANQSEDDIILKDKLDDMAAKHDNFEVYYMVDKPKWGGAFWKGGVGYITKDVIEKHMPPPSDDNLIMVCGPPPMYKALSGDKAPDKTQGPLTGLLKDMGYTEKQVFKF